VTVRNQKIPIRKVSILNALPKTGNHVQWTQGVRSHVDPNKEDKHVSILLDTKEHSGTCHDEGPSQRGLLAS